MTKVTADRWMLLGVVLVAVAIVVAYVRLGASYMQQPGQDQYSQLSDEGG